jgi:hypothetical protein
MNLTSPLYSLLFALTLAQSIDVARASAPESTAADHDGCGQSYTVENGDTYAKIARERLHLTGEKEIFGPQGGVQKMIALNKKQVPNPNQIQPGIKIILPCDEPVTAELAPSTKRLSRRLQREASDDELPITIPVEVGFAAVEPVPEAKPPAPVIEEPPVEVEEDLPAPEVVRAPKPKKVKPPVSRKPTDPYSSFSIGGGILGTDGSATLPNGGVDLDINLGRGISLKAEADGFIATYGIDTGQPFSTLQAQYSLEVNFKMFRYFSLGLGYRLFTFGYANPANSTAMSHDAVLSVGFHFIPFGNAEWDSVLDTRTAISSTSSTAGTFASYPQFSGVRFHTSIRLPLGSDFFFGPYFYFETISLNLTQNPGSTSTPSFLYNGMGGGVQLGVKF